MILRSDLDFPCYQILHRLIGTAMTELKFEGPSTKGKSQDLVSQTDPEYGFLSDEIADGINQVWHALGIAWAAGQEYALGLKGQYLLGGSRGRDNDNITAMRSELSEDIISDATIHRDHQKRR